MKRWKKMSRRDDSKVMHFLYQWQFVKLSAASRYQLPNRPLPRCCLCKPPPFHLWPLFCWDKAQPSCSVPSWQTVRLESTALTCGCGCWKKKQLEFTCLYMTSDQPECILTNTRVGSQEVIKQQWQIQTRNLEPKYDSYFNPEIIISAKFGSIQSGLVRRVRWQPLFCAACPKQ